MDEALRKDDEIATTRRCPTEVASSEREIRGDIPDLRTDLRDTDPKAVE